MTHLFPASTLALFGTPVGFGELIVLGLLGVLIFGKRLPEVGRSLGKGIVEFKKGLTGLEDEFNNAGRPAAADQRGPAKLEARGNNPYVDTQLHTSQAASASDTGAEGSAAPSPAESQTAQQAPAKS